MGLRTPGNTRSYQTRGPDLTKAETCLNSPDLILPDSTKASRVRPHWDSTNDETCFPVMDSTNNKTCSAATHSKINEMCSTLLPDKTSLNAPDSFALPRDGLKDINDIPLATRQDVLERARLDE